MSMIYELCKFFLGLFPILGLCVLWPSSARSQDAVLQIRSADQIRRAAAVPVLVDEQHVYYATVAHAFWRLPSPRYYTWIDQHPAQVMHLFAEGRDYDLAIVRRKRLEGEAVVVIPLSDVELQPGQHVVISGGLNGGMRGTFRYFVREVPGNLRIGEILVTRAAVAGDSGSAVILDGGIVGIFQGGNGFLGNFVPGSVIRRKLRIVEKRR